MAVQLTVVAASPAELASIWGQLGGRAATVDLQGDDVHITVDLRYAFTEDDIAAVVGPESGDKACAIVEPHHCDQPHDDPYGELTPEQEAQVEEVLSHPIHPEGPWEDAEHEHDGDTVDVGEVVEPEPQADIVPIDAGSRAKHPAGGTLASKVLTLLQSSPDEEFTPSDVLDSLDAEGATYGGISGTIATLVRNGQIQRVGRGKYKAAAS